VAVAVAADDCDGGVLGEWRASRKLLLRILLRTIGTNKHSEWSRRERTTSALPSPPPPPPLPLLRCRPCRMEARAIRRTAPLSRENC